MTIDLSKYSGTRKDELVGGLTSMLLDQNFTVDNHFTLKDIDVTYRNITHWDNEGLLLKQSTKGKWRKFSFPELIWMNMITQMRAFGLPLELIKKVKREVNKPMSPKELFPDFGYQEQREAIKGIPFTMLMILIMECIIKQTNVSILINHNGEVLPFSEADKKEILSAEENQELYFNSHLSISISQILSKFIIKKDVNSHVKTALLNENELEVLNLLQKGRIKKIEITLKNNRVLQTKQITSDIIEKMSRRYIDVLTQKGYKKIKFQTVNGKTTEFQKDYKQD